MALLRLLRVTPVPKPRMTKADAWKKRPVVLNYWAYKQQLRLEAGVFNLPTHDAWIIFYLPMPKSWSKKKRADMDGQPHEVRPDVDNLHKGLLDGFFEEDAGVWDHRITKRWAAEGSILIRTMD